MPELNFHIEGAAAVPYAAAPQLALKLRISNAPADEPIHAVLLRCQVQIEVTRRRYQPLEKTRLFDLFGKPEDWHRTLRTVLWTSSNVNVPGFTDHTLMDVPVPCTYDLSVAAAKYFEALDDGEVPLLVLFSGTVFYGAEGALQVAQIPWEKEAKYRLPLSVWRDLMDHYYADRVPLFLPKDLYRQVQQHRHSCGLATWEQALEELLSSTAEHTTP
jgi:hypothetical protein